MKAIFRWRKAEAELEFLMQKIQKKKKWWREAFEEISKIHPRWRLKNWSLKRLKLKHEDFMIEDNQ